MEKARQSLLVELRTFQSNILRMQEEVQDFLKVWVTYRQLGTREQEELLSVLQNFEGTTLDKASSQLSAIHSLLEKLSLPSAFSVDSLNNDNGVDVGEEGVLVLKEDEDGQGDLQEVKVEAQGATDEIPVFYNESNDNGHLNDYDLFLEKEDDVKFEVIEEEENTNIDVQQNVLYTHVEIQQSDGHCEVEEAEPMPLGFVGVPSPTSSSRDYNYQNQNQHLTIRQIIDQAEKPCATTLFEPHAGSSDIQNASSIQVVASSEGIPIILLIDGYTFSSTAKSRHVVSKGTRKWLLERWCCTSSSKYPNPEGPGCEVVLRFNIADDPERALSHPEEAIKIIGRHNHPSTFMNKLKKKANMKEHRRDSDSDVVPGQTISKRCRRRR